MAKRIRKAVIGLMGIIPYGEIEVENKSTSKVRRQFLAKRKDEEKVERKNNWGIRQTREYRRSHGRITS